MLSVIMINLSSVSEGNCNRAVREDRTVLPTLRLCGGVSMGEGESLKQGLLYRRYVGRYPPIPGHPPPPPPYYCSVFFLNSI